MIEHVQRHILQNLDGDHSNKLKTRTKTWMEREEQLSDNLIFASFIYIFIS
jgi:hypothetical protein